MAPDLHSVLVSLRQLFTESPLCLLSWSFLLWWDLPEFICEDPILPTFKAFCIGLAYTFSVCYSPSPDSVSLSLSPFRLWAPWWRTNPSWMLGKHLACSGCYHKNKSFRWLIRISMGSAAGNPTCMILLSHHFTMPLHWLPWRYSWLTPMCSEIRIRPIIH